MIAFVDFADHKDNDAGETKVARGIAQKDKWNELENLIRISSEFVSRFEQSSNPIDLLELFQCFSHCDSS
jgi:hypothetical protein